LQELLRHDSPIVRCYAVRGLLDTEAKVDWPQVVLACIGDQAEVTERSSCETSKCPAGDLVFQLVRTRKVLRDEAMLDVAEQLVLRKSPLFAREWALRNLQFRDGMLHTIRTLAEAGDAPALVALARYRLQKDLPLLLARLQRPDPFADNCRFLAAEISADPKLLPALQALVPAAFARLQVDSACRLRFWLAAIAVQDGEAAAAVLRTFVLGDLVPAGRRRDLLETVVQALDERPRGPELQRLRGELAQRLEQR